MALEVIGAGFGRTGTMALKIALEQLGFGPCYHMVDVIRTPGAAQHWLTAAEGGPMAWDAVFAGYRSAVDWPACDYWRELAAHWPAAKIVLTTRDAESWFRSTQDTIHGPANPFNQDSSPLGRMIRAIGVRNFVGRINDRATCIAAFERHNATVRREAPADRLLDYRVADGWEPLCRFLGVPVPDAPFPKANTTEDFVREVRSIVAAPDATG